MAATGAGGKLQPRRHIYRPRRPLYGQKPRTSGFTTRHLTAGLEGIVPFITSPSETPRQETGRYLRLQGGAPLPPATPPAETTIAAQEEKEHQVPKPTRPPGEVQTHPHMPRLPSIWRFLRLLSGTVTSTVRSAPYAAPTRIQVTARSRYNTRLGAPISYEAREIMNAMPTRNFVRDEGENIPSSIRLQALFFSR